jgi:AraC-like DNA-binding protein
MKPVSPLERFFSELARLTGLELCVFDLNYFTKDSPELSLDSNRRIHACAYCRLVKSKPDAWRKCIETEYWRAEKAATLDHPLLHTCYAGVTDLILPIKSGRKQIGALYLGQIITHSREKQARVMQKLARVFGHSLAELTKTAVQQPRLHPDQLLRLGTLLKAIRNHVEQAVELAELRRRQSGADMTPDRRVPAGKPTPMSEVPIYFLRTFKPASDQIRHAVELVAKGYWQNITQPTVAREVGLSISQFSRLFHQETGMTFRSCLMQTRLEAAGYLLKRFSVTVSQVADMVGYHNNSSMQRAFRRLKGVTPKMFIHRQGEQEFCLKDKEELARTARKRMPEMTGNAPK